MIKYFLLIFTLWSGLVLAQTKTITYKLDTTEYKLEVVCRSVPDNIIDEVGKAIAELGPGVKLVVEEDNIIGMVSKNIDGVTIYLFYQLPNNRVYIHEHIIKNK